jgi:hypothetical protein
MDSRVEKAVLEKIGEAVAEPAEIMQLSDKLRAMHLSSRGDFAIGLAVGRIYNSFHYQTRRILKRNATPEEFAEFLDILQKNSDKIKSALEIM